ncbi:asparagine synthase (glutamine-hydrolyzing) [Symbiobacterium terraclitae]|uniref:asparagine synthase (glutamine-hydrolyzing) n=1 Tax=Symbiobacterium terraclitae TaxID=557451 RepID=A0ABS4JX62_9FIRM|nr:asparagine synthase B [Symbiobacterium terraclitae]MBP2020122.1 asparagine synthase (glutamine-hydrolyzing) [Symbiobacterium terraclitae]
MCGIAGIAGRADHARIGRMLDALAHRGPDGRRVWTTDGFGLGHARLAVVDVGGGGQPLANEDGSLWLAMDGEIYNHRALRQELAGRHTFRTQSDAEVVLHLYEEYGPECVERLDGHFAVAVWSAEEGLFLARDALGVKPLYWGEDAEGNLLFASEIRALIDEVAQVREFPPGHRWLAGGPMVAWDRIPRPTGEWAEAAAVADALDRTLDAAVRKRLVADVPVGCFLSGGLDSSLVAALARQRLEGELHTFAVGLEGSTDLKVARQVAAYLGTIHHERVLTEGEIVEALPRVIDALESCDPALVRGSIATYFASELAAEHVKVVLSGEGADELFAGYHYLSDFDGDERGLAEELYAITAALHNTGLQRVDRMTTAHGLQARAPFLDREMLDLAARTAPALKRRDGEGKWILRTVAERYLPRSVVWRTKEKFAIGTGVGPALERYAALAVSDTELERERSPRGQPFASKEEYLYWSLFRERYGRDDVLELMGRSRSLNPGQRWVGAL